LIKRNEVLPEHGIEGAWSGHVDVSGSRVALVLHVATAEDGGWSVQADFPQLHRNRMPFAEVSLDDGELRFRSRSLGAFAGRMSDDGERLAGMLGDGAAARPIAFDRGVAAPPAPARPQHPLAPFPYEVEDVFIDATAGRLAGTLTKPRAPPRALALLVPGSGAMDRDETVFGHKPFLVLADHLARNGYASLRLDDRGVGASTGDRSAITVRDEADDVRAAFDWLSTRADLAGVPIGLLGHSMGCTVASMVAGERSRVAFLVSMAGAGAPLAEVFAEREGDALRRLGFDDAAIERHRAFAVAVFAMLRDDATPIDAAALDACAVRLDAAASMRAIGTQAWIARYNEAWFRSALRLEPARLLAPLRMPVLAINGSLDRQVPCSNLEAIAHVFAANGHRDARTIELAGLNHLLQTCTTGEAHEYPIIEETFAPRALDAIRHWLDARFPAKPA
jgi:pimeloyl-ACP methyl ester carboxylesterase